MVECGFFRQPYMSLSSTYTDYEEVKKEHYSLTKVQNHTIIFNDIDIPYLSSTQAGSYSVQKNHNSYLF